MAIAQGPLPQPLRVHKAISCFKKRTLPLLETLDGKVASHPAEARKVWHSHFASVDAGSTQLLSDHASEVIAGQNASPVVLPSSVASVCTLPVPVGMVSG